MRELHTILLTAMAVLPAVSLVAITAMAAAPTIGDRVSSLILRATR